ncbi:pantoate--beta-alanine ligase [Aestuariibius sp. HNIBRBA575]|uniref:pantoate--beta-alanine ligase n=1 Tax=Aestuariibius sp. HNIBRBA575 TaxID=3233343 RepID=UPI0034A2B4A4
MKICRSIAEMRAQMAAFRNADHSVGLVTTMGALHAGHMALVKSAVQAHSRVVATIFVNPTQFGDPSDLDNYPRTEEADLTMLRDAGVAAVFIPDAGDMYPDGDETIVETTGLANMLHGLVRPGHFRGVATVVTKLFNIVQADAAYFGEKDFQQLAVIRRLVRDLHMPIQIVGVPTVREADGLAMSSRNVRLTAPDRAAAIVLNQALSRAEMLAAEGAQVDILNQAIRDTITAEPRATLMAVDIVIADTFEPATGPVTQTIGIMISAQFGAGDNQVLLIDQREIHP